MFAARRIDCGGCRAADQMRGMISVVTVMHLPTDNFSAVEVQDEIELKPASQSLRWQIGHVPAPHLAGAAGDVRGGWPSCLGCLGPSAVGGLSLRLEHTTERGLAGQLNAFVSQHGDDARRGYGSKAQRVSDGQHLCTLGLAEGVPGRGAHGQGPTIATEETIHGFPALQGAQLDTGDRSVRIFVCEAERDFSTAPPPAGLSSGRRAARWESRCSY